jgi:hypothetical protein
MIGSYKGLAFSGTAMNEVYMLYHIPHDIKPNTRMIPHFHWSPLDGSAGNVIWFFEYHYAKRDGGANDVFPAAATLSATGTPSSEGGANAHVVTEIPDPNNGILVTEPDGLLLVRIYRDGANVGDTYSPVCWLHSVDLHYQSDREGTPSRNPDYYTP